MATARQLRFMPGPPSTASLPAPSRNPQYDGDLLWVNKNASNWGGGGREEDHSIRSHVHAKFLPWNKRHRKITQPQISLKTRNKTPQTGVEWLSNDRTEGCEERGCSLPELSREDSTDHDTSTSSQHSEATTRTLQTPTLCLCSSCCSASGSRRPRTEDNPVTTESRCLCCADTINSAQTYRQSQPSAVIPLKPQPPISLSNFDPTRSPSTCSRHETEYWLGSSTTAPATTGNREVYTKPLIGIFVDRYVSPEYRNNSTNAGPGAWALTAGLAADNYVCEFLTSALVSTSLCILAVQQRDTRMLSGALRTYHEALPRLRKELIKRKKSKTRSTKGLTPVVLACLLCGIFEYLLGSWHNSDMHLEGITAILEDEGLAALTKTPMRHLYLEHRATILGCHFLYRRANVYSNPVWLRFAKTEMATGDYGIFQQFADKAYPVIPILEEYESRTRTGLAEGEADSFIQRFETHINCLKQWRSQSALSAIVITGPERSLESVKSIDGSLSSMYEPALARIGLEASMTFGYWSACMIHLFLIVLELEQYRRPKQNPASPHGHESLVRHSLAICAAVSLCLRQQSSLDCQLFLLFPLDSCWSACKVLEKRFPQLDMHRTKSWFQAVSDKLRKNGFKPFREPWLEEA